MATEQGVYVFYHFLTGQAAGGAVARVVAVRMKRMPTMAASRPIVVRWSDQPLDRSACPARDDVAGLLAEVKEGVLSDCVVAKTPTRLRMTSRAR